MERADYEWHYYIGGNCSLQPRKGGRNVAKIIHVEQGKYEALLLRWEQWSQAEPWSLGIYNDSNEAQAVIEQTLQPLWEKA